MTIFIKALFDLKLVSQDSLKQMTTQRDGEGMGITTFTFAGRTLYGETGGSGSSGAIRRGLLDRRYSRENDGHPGRRDALPQGWE